MNDLEMYIKSWRSFEIACEKKVKDVCIINNKGWKKLREFHLKEYLTKHPSPFGFMFKLKYKHPRLYRRIDCAAKLYHMSRKWRNDKFDKKAPRSVVKTPSWRGLIS